MSAKNTIGAGLAVLAVLGGVWVYRKRRAAAHPARGWMLRMKADILDRLEKVRDVNKDAYNRTVEHVAHHYQNVRKAGRSELAALVKDLKEDWREVGGKILIGNGR